MPMSPARQQYNKRPAPPSYDKGFFDLELGNIQRAIQRPVARAVTVSDTVTATDDLILADATGGALAVTLPPPDRVQFLRVTIKRVNAGANAVTIGGTVDATVNPTLAARWAAITVQSDGTSWLKLSSV